MTCFCDLHVGDSAQLLNLNGLDAVFRHRLMSMGLTPGTEFKVQQVAPLGDPVQILVRGFHLSVRRQEMADVEVIRQ